MSQQVGERRAETPAAERFDTNFPVMRSIPSANGRSSKRGRGFATVVTTAVFSAAQMWGVLVVLVLVRADGVAKVALACVLAGALTAVYLAWHHVRGLAKAEQVVPDDRQQDSRPNDGWRH